MTHALSLPGNTEHVYLDVIAQSESNDEFWYLLVPNDQITNLESCGNIATAIAFIAVENQRSRHRVPSSVLHHGNAVIAALLQLKRGAAPKEIHANAAVLPVSGARIKRYRNGEPSVCRNSSTSRVFSSQIMTQRCLRHRRVINITPVIVFF
jgi:hypothetical protein